MIALDVDEEVINVVPRVSMDQETYDKLYEAFKATGRKDFSKFLARVFRVGIKAVIRGESID